MQEMTEDTETWQLDGQVRYRRLFDEGVLLHQEQAEALVLNDTAMAFLELCDGHRSTAEIITEMTGQYDVGQDELLNDLKDLIKELNQAGIIHPVEGDFSDSAS